MTIKFYSIAAVSLAAVLVAGPVRAAGAGDTSNDPLASLGGSAVNAAQLSAMRGGTFVASSVNIGIDTGNSANNSVTGGISNNQSVNNNTGLTTVLQNTGNNALLQSSMTINIAVQ
ncbi:hypothetical protein [Acidocella sp.]|uniref:hypothetical protein n=1 Tax=Acidocella sp. TaxID=50710 RepID=UPI00261A4EBF|nr:hypothetical protein [Acidocella sp.]